MNSYLVQRARPVADASVEALLERSEELARQWTFALLAAHPLAEMTAVPLEQLVRHAPALCASAARALASEEELASFGAVSGPPGSGAAALQALAADWNAAATVDHVEALRRVLWETALGALANPSPREVADLADRLGSVCAVLLGAALGKEVGLEHKGSRREPRPARERVLYRAPVPEPGRLGAVLIDELEDGANSPRVAPLPREPSASSAPRAAAVRTMPRPLPWDIPLEAESATGSEPRVEIGERDEDTVLRVSRGPFSGDDERSL